jgi:UDP-N-acetylmuramate--alanine ligase
MSSEALAEELKKLGADAYHLPSFEAIENFVLEKVIHGDVLITMGAGDVVNIGDSLLQ